MTLNNLAAALAQLALLPPSATRLALAAQVADAGRRHLAPVPSWVTGYLERCLASARAACLPKEELVEPLLTLHLLTGREAYELEAITIINACYRQIADLATTGNPFAVPLNVGMHPGASASRPESGKTAELTPLNVGMHPGASAPRPESGNALTLDSSLLTLYIVATCCDYIDDYNPTLVLSAYHRLTSLLETSAKALAPSQRAKLAELSEQLALPEAV